MRGIRIKLNDFEYRLLMALLDKTINNTKMPNVRIACSNIRNQIQSKMKIVDKPFKSIAYEVSKTNMTEMNKTLTEHEVMDMYGGYDE